MSRTVVPALLGVVFFVGCREQSKTSPAPVAEATIRTDGHAVEVDRTRKAQRSVDSVQHSFTVARPNKSKFKKAKPAAVSALMPIAAVDHYVSAGPRALVAVAPGVGVGAVVELPLESDGVMRVASGGLLVAAKPIGLARKTAEFAQKIAVHAGVTDHTDLFRRIDHDGVEDFYRVETPRDRVTYAYDVALTNVAGLRLVSGSLELLDATGTPRLATNAPVVIDSKGVKRTGTLSVRGCNYDTDPSGPWGREVTAAGKDHCEVVFDVDTKGLSFPVLVDPAWFATDKMKQTRAWHQLLQLPVGAKDGGKILAVGGTGTLDAATMLYDTTTGTWATSGSLTETHGEGSNAVVFSDGTVLIAGGLGTTIAAKPSAEVRNKTTGVWSAAAAMTARAYFAAGIVKIGGKERALVAGGYPSSSTSVASISTAETYDPATDTWTDTGVMKAARGKIAGAVLTDGRFLVAGGENNTATSATLKSAETYDPATNAWTATGTMVDARSNHAIVAVAGGKAVVAGGYDDDAFIQLDSVEYWNGATWSASTTKLTEIKQDPIAALLTDGRVVVAGGWSEDLFGTGDTITTASTDLIDLGATPATTLKVVGSGSMKSARTNAAAVSLGLKVLVSGGFPDHSVESETTASEIFDATIGKACGAGCATGLFCTDGVCCKTATCGTGESCAAPGFEGVCTKGKGSTCTSGSECGSGFCVTGICCESACNGECTSCNEVGKLGTCVAAPAGTDPTGACLFGEDPGCGPTCDSTGSCGFESAPAGTKCGASATDAGTGSFCEAFACDGFGTCETSSPTCGLDCVAAADCTEATKSCTPTATKPGKCAIEGKCYEFGDVSPTDPCKICDPVTDKFTWSESSDCIDGGIVDSGPADTGSEDTGAVDTGTGEDTGVVDTGTEADATTDTGSSGPGDLPEGQACSCDVPGADAHGSPLAATFVALGLAIASRRRRK